ncbi:MAG: trypsin-like peptidase domain-containing protein, partial [Lentisphaerae bacterium]|nr:trypsin-like peptidase domain-containing protein [Lentisphaerota bacterium]
MATAKAGSSVKWVAFLYILFAAACPATSNFDAAFSAVVKVHVVFQREDHTMPWQGGRPISATGTGFIIDGKRILTNAHVVSDAKFLQVQKNDDARMYDAVVEFIGHDCDLATLVVEDLSFYENTEALTFANTLPTLNDTVTVIGYPAGGSKLSITKGVVSRLDYNVYTHSGVDYHLVIQVDAAVNPGNSGGPVMLNNHVVGLAFQGLSNAENIGYGIPVPVLRHFLDDIADGIYHGYPELGIGFMDTRNPAMREQLLMTDQMSGVVVYYVDPFGSAITHLKNGDVLLSIDGHRIADDGTINVDDNTLIFSELLERKQCGETVK